MTNVSTSSPRMVAIWYRHAIQVIHPSICLRASLERRNRHIGGRLGCCWHEYLSYACMFAPLDRTASLKPPWTVVIAAYFNLWHLIVMHGKNTRENVCFRHHSFSVEFSTSICAVYKERRGVSAKCFYRKVFYSYFPNNHASKGVKEALWQFSIN